MEKKVSFGFSKVVKKAQLLNKPSKPPDIEEKIELIECLEGQTIKVTGGSGEDDPDAPLVIPVIANSTPLEKRIQLRDDRAERAVAKSNPIEPAEAETLEDRAAREILQGLKATEEEEGAADTFTVPLSADELKLGGAQESTMDDYEEVPITQFGLAMLRGMGWKDVEHKKKEKRIEEEIIVCRPKGLGLGADKAMKQQVHLATNSANTTDNLVMKKNACVRIVAGKHKDYYGRVEGMDDESGRVFIKLALGGNRESINEGFVKLVTEKEYNENRKVLNVAKYEEYKKKTVTNVEMGRTDKDRNSNCRPKTTAASRSSDSRRDREYTDYNEGDNGKGERNDSSKYRNSRKDTEKDRRGAWERSRSRDRGDRNDAGGHNKQRSKQERDYKSYGSRKDRYDSGGSRRDR